MPSKNMRFDAKRDANERPIKKALEEVGIVVWKVNGKDQADLACYNRNTHKWYMLEIKVKGGKLTAGQKGWEEAIEAGAVKIGHTIEQAFDAVEVTRIKSEEINRTNITVTLTRNIERGEYLVSVIDCATLAIISHDAISGTYAEALAAYDKTVAKAINVRDFGESWID